MVSRHADPSRRGRVATPPRVLVIAGVDPGGAAGIGADLRTVAALGGHALPVVTALTVQDSRAVREVAPVPPRLVRAQIDAALGDAGADAAKVGMLATAPVARAVAAALARHPQLPLVVDPVLRASTGRSLLDGPGRGALLRHLVPLATLLTPNLAEAAAILGWRSVPLRRMREAAEGLLELGARAVLITGGHLRGEPADLLADGRRFVTLRGRRIATADTHGSGCVLATAIAALLARGLSLLGAVRLAKRFVSAAIRSSYRLGSGAGTLNPPAAALALGIAADPWGR